MGHIALTNVATLKQFSDSNGTSIFANDMGITAGSVITLGGSTGFLQLGSGTGQHIAFDTTQIQAKSNATTADDLLLNPLGGNVGIGTISPDGGLDISDGGKSLIIGADSSLKTRTNVTDKFSRIASVHYINAEQPVALMVTTSQTSANTITIGGGSSLLNSATKIRFNTASDTTTVTGTVRMTIDSSGNVGIGIASPTNALSVEKTISGDFVAEFKQGDSTSGQSFGVNITAGTNSSDVALRVANQAQGELFRINGDGNVGIGTTSPNMKLDIYEVNALDAELRIGTRNTPGTSKAKILFAHSSATHGDAPGGQIASIPEDSYAFSANADAALVFYSAINSVDVERMRITSAGKVGIGTASPGFLLSLEGAVAANNLGIAIINTETDGFATMVMSDGVSGTGGIFRNGSANSQYAGISSLNLITVGADNIGFSTTNAIRMIITGAGNVGIGTASPDAKLHVQQASNTKAAALFNNGGGGAPAAVLIVEDGQSSTHYGLFVGDTDFTNPVLITKHNDVGIGIKDPEYQMHIKGDGQETAALTDSGNTGGSLYIQASGTNTNDGGAIYFGSGPGHNAAIKSLTFSNAGNTIGDLAFSTRNATGDTALTERMRIKLNGDVGIGETAPEGRLHIKTSDVGAISPATKADELVLESNGNCGITMYSFTAGTGTIYFADVDSDTIGWVEYNHNADTLGLGVNGSTRLFINSSGAVTINGLTGSGTEDCQLTSSGVLTRITSDERLKKDIKDFKLGLKEILNLQPRLFKWKDSDRGLDFNAGFIAQEVELFIPQAVGINGDGYKSLSDKPIIATLVNSTKELNIKIEKSVKELELEIQKLNKRIKILEVV